MDFVSTGNPFGKTGCCANFRQLLGDNTWKWFVPVRREVQDNLNFEIDPRSLRFLRIDDDD